MSSAPAKKPANPAKATPKRAPAKAATPQKAVVKAAAPVAVPVQIAETAQDKNAAVTRTRDLISRVAEATGGKVKDLKPMIEAALLEMGKALDAGDMLNLPPLGKLKLAGNKPEAAGAPMKLKLHRPNPDAKPGKGAKEGLAEDGEDS